MMIKFLFLLTLILSSACSLKSPRQDLSLQNIEGKAFGSTWELKYSGGPSPENLKGIIDVFLKEFDKEFSTYRPDSVISGFNELPPLRRLKVSLRFIHLLKLAQQFHQETQGAFDPSIGQTIRLWGFGGGKKNIIPSQQALKVAKTQSGMDAIKWDESSLEVWKTRSLILDVNAFAPGFAADLLAQDLEHKGIKNFVLNVGGEILFRGKKQGLQEWVAGIETPDEAQENDVYLAFKISDLALATSGNYRQFRIDQGIKKSHIIDPFTHRPLQGDIISASVIASSAAQADAWSTAMMVLGEKGISQAEILGLKVILIKKSPSGLFKKQVSPSFEKYLKN